MADVGLYPRGTVDYDKIDAVNFSTLKELATSPKRYRYRKTNPRPQTNEMRFGTATHTAVLEPNRFGNECVMFTGPVRRGKKWDAFQLEHADKQILTRAEYVEAARIRDAVLEDPVCCKYLDYGQPEVALVWRDEETGVLCKGRLDWLCSDPEHTIVDLKSARAIEPFHFCRSAGRLLYHMQVAFYSDGYEAITGKQPERKILAVESEPPHDPVVYNMPGEVLDVGRDEYRSLLVKLQYCRERDEWPGLANGAELEFQLPAYLMPDESALDDLGLEF